MKPTTHVSVEQIGGAELNLSTGEFAKQANGSVMVTYGETVVLGTATMRKAHSTDGDWLPLLVDYEEKYYAAGKIKGSRFVKREGRPHDEAILTARLIDRAIRPLFPDNMIDDIQVVLTVLSYDGVNAPDIPAMVAAFAALMISDIPWNGNIAPARIGRVDGEFVVNPTVEQREVSTLDLVLAGNSKDVVMVEAGAHEFSESDMLDAIEFGQKAMGKTFEVMEKLQKEAGKTKEEPTLQIRNEEGIKKIQELGRAMLSEKLAAANDKDSIGAAERDVQHYVWEQLSDEDKETITQQLVAVAIHELHAEIARTRVLEEGVRSDGRALDEVRSLYVRAGVLPRTHGSAMFQRGNTQVLTTLTLGGPSDMLTIDSMQMDPMKKVMTTEGTMAPNDADQGTTPTTDNTIISTIPQTTRKRNLCRRSVVASNAPCFTSSTIVASNSLTDSGVNGLIPLEMSRHASSL